ncbi:hypothetical protein Tco_1477837 [Tanacetum coccineum]
MLAISSTLLMCLTALSVGLPEKEIFCNSVRSCPLTSNVELSGRVKLLLVLFRLRAGYCSKVEFFEGWKPLSPLQLAMEEVMSE